MTSASRKKIAILGGGVAALTAALELTEQDPDQSQYDITIYTLGWRLGGKCASRRDMDNYGRAYEHGLHVWAGFYDNAFHVIQILYKALGEDEGAWGALLRAPQSFHRHRIRRRTLASVADLRAHQRPRSRD